MRTETGTETHLAERLCATTAHAADPDWTVPMVFEDATDPVLRAAACTDCQETARKKFRKSA